MSVWVCRKLRDRRQACRRRRTCAMQADVQALAERRPPRPQRVPPRRRAVRSMMLLPSRVPKLVPPTDDVLVAAACRAGPATGSRSRPALSRVDLDDHAFDVDLRAARVELVDHRAHLAVQRLGRGDDQRVGRRVGLDEAAGRGRGRRVDRRGRRASAAPAALAAGAGGGLRQAGVRSTRRRRRRRRRRRLPSAEGRAQHGGQLASRRRSSGARPRCCRRAPSPAAAGRAWRSSARTLAMRGRVRRAHDQRVAARVDQHRRRRAPPGTPGAPALAPAVASAAAPAAPCRRPPRAAAG